MYGHRLLSLFEALRILGVVETHRAFARWMGRGPDYVRDLRRLGGHSRVHPSTISCLREKLMRLANEVPSGIAADIEAIIATIDQDLAISRALRRAP